MKAYETAIWNVDNFTPPLEKHPQIIQASMWIKNEEVIAFPTETVYGLGADARSSSAVKRIFEAKGRPSDNPLIVHISDLHQLEGLVREIPPQARALMEVFWPGPLTIIMPKGKNVSDAVTAGLDTVAVRMPDHPVALSLIQASQAPLAAPSANLSGKPSPTTAQHVFLDLKGRIPGIVDGGATGVGVESTVVDCSEGKITILRPGGVTKEAIEAVTGLGTVDVDPALISSDSAPKSPGMKYTHYAPDAPFVLVDGTREFLQELVDKERETGKKVGVLTTEENASFYEADAVIPMGRRGDLESVARHVYDSLRSFNEAGVDQIFGEVFPKKGVGAAIMNRLEKSAGGNILREQR